MNNQWIRMACLFGVLIIVSGIIWTSFQTNTLAQPQVTRQSGDTDLLARLITAEAESEPYIGQVAVGAVILNRVQSSKFPNTLAGVVYQPHAFESVSNGRVNQPATDSCRKAAQAAVGGWDPSGGALFFFNPSKVVGPSFVWSRKIIQRIGKHVFAL